MSQSSCWRFSFPLRRTSEQVEDIMFLDLKGRLIKTLLRLCRNPANAQGIDISQTDLSQMIGVRAR